MRPKLAGLIESDCNKTGKSNLTVLGVSENCGCTAARVVIIGADDALLDVA
jgi:hypothetical protein